MAAVQKMTLEELQRLIDERIDLRFAYLLDELSREEEADLLQYEQSDRRTWSQVQADIERDRWTPPPDAKSSLELLREDRDG